jgi:S-DNA-T family DNA segregation ATPase FtsK/SpoIIIE
MTVAPPPELSDSAAPDVDVEQSVALFNRPPRVLRVPPTDEIEIPGPPQAPGSNAGMRLAAVIIPLTTAFVYLLMAFARSGGSGRGMLMALPIVLIASISGGVAFFSYRKQKQDYAAAVAEYHASYQDALDKTRRRLEQLERQQRACFDENDPDLENLLHIAQGEINRDNDPVPAARLWERRPQDPDFLCLRCGRGDRLTTLTIKPPSVNAYTKDVEQSLMLADQFRILRNVPLSINLRTVGSIGIAGPSGRTLNTIQALLWQIVVHHSPSEVRIAAFWESSFDDAWEWLRYLPHTRSLDGDSSYRLLARYDRNLEDMQRVVGALAKEMKRRAEDENSTGRRPHLIVIMSDYHLHQEDAPFFAQCITGRSLDVSAICLVPEVRDVPSDCGGYLDLVHGGSNEHARIGLAGVGGGYTVLKADMANSAQSRDLALLLGPVELADADGGREMPRNVPLLELLHIADAKTYDPMQFWAHLPTDSWHPVPVGRQSADATIDINLNEGIHGVHGMIAGATGAGKSELLLSFLMALAVKHHPDRLNFLLIDFKGGATFRDIDQLPHTAGLVTDLSGFEAERALIALNSELDKRKRLLSKRGVPNIKGYRKAGFDRQGHPLPNLLVTIDEFDEMIRDYPEFQDELIRVSKQGRSLGVHLLFATQQPSLIKQGLLNNLSYWMSLRVNSREDSKAMAGVPDAALLGTDTPGRGYFRDKNSGARLFQSALVTATYRPSAGRSSIEIDITGHMRVNTGETRARQMVFARLDELIEARKQSEIESVREQLLESAVQDIAVQAREVLEHQVSVHDPAECQQIVRREIGQLVQEIRQLNVGADQANAVELVEATIANGAARLINQMMGEREKISEIQLLSRRMIDTLGANYAAERYRVWEAPLPRTLPLIDLQTRFAAAGSAFKPAWLDVAYGLIDRPDVARQDPLRTDLAGNGGNLLVLGASGSGKTTLLRSVILALANAHSPADLWFYLVDSAGSGLGLSERLPHIADTLATRAHLLVERLFSEIQEELEARRSLFQRYGVANLAEYRERSGVDDPPAPPAIVIVVDNLADLTSQNEQVTDILKSLIRESRAHGIYFLVTAYAARDVSSLAASFETRLALRLNSDEDSAMLIGKDFASKLIKPDQSGRAFLKNSPRPLEVQIALPALQAQVVAGNAGAEDDDTGIAYSDIHREVERSAEQVRDRWQSQSALIAAERLPRKLRLLPAGVDIRRLLEDTPPTAAPQHCVPIGIGGSNLDTMFWELDRVPHLLISGSDRVGKDALLQMLVAALAGRYDADNIEFVLVDYSMRAFREIEQLRHVRRFNELKFGNDTRDIVLVTDKDELKAVCGALKDELASRLTALRRGQATKRRTVLLLHNWDLVAQDTPITADIDTFVRRGSDIGMHCVALGNDTGVLGRMSLGQAMRTGYAEIVIGRPPDNATYASDLKRRFKSALSGEMPAGRGVFLESGQPPRLAQFAAVTPEFIADLVAPPALVR